MLNIITLADATQAEAAQRPLAGFGAGAFTCDGARVGYGNELTATQALPRIKWAAVISEGHVQAGFAGGAYRTSPILADAALTEVARLSALQAYSQHFNQMTRIRPVTPGGVGPHPAREPDPV